MHTHMDVFLGSVFTSGYPFKVEEICPVVREPIGSKVQLTVLTVSKSFKSEPETDDTKMVGLVSSVSYSCD